VEVVDASGCFGSSSVESGDEDPIFLIQAELATVKKLVVQGTKSHAVVQVIGSAKVEPPDVGRLETYRRRTELSVIAAEGALAIPGFKDREWPRRRSSSPFCVRHLGRSNGEHLVRVQTNRDEYVRGDRPWELRVDQQSGRSLDLTRPRHCPFE